MQPVAAVKFERFNLTLADGSSAHLRGELVTRNYFQTVGVPLARGREFTVDEARGAAPLPAIITDAVWREQFHQSDDVLGQSVLLNGVPATIVGVTPPGFHGTSFAPNLQICVPVVSYSRLRGTESQLIDAKILGVGILGRLAPHASIETAQKEFDNLWADEDGQACAAGSLYSDGLRSEFRPAGTPLHDDPDGGGAAHAAGGLRQRGQPSASALGGAAARDRDPPVAGRTALPHRAQPARGGPGALAGGDRRPRSCLPNGPLAPWSRSSASTSISHRIAAWWVTRCCSRWSALWCSPSLPPGERCATTWQLPSSGDRKQRAY